MRNYNGTDLSSNWKVVTFEGKVISANWQIVEIDKHMTFVISGAKSRPVQGIDYRFAAVAAKMLSGVPVRE